MFSDRGTVLNQIQKCFTRN